MHIFGGSKGKAPPAGGAGGAGGPAAGPLALVTEPDFEPEVLLAETPCLVEFTSARSQASQAIAPEVEAFAEEMEGKLKVVRLDIDGSPGLVRQLRIQQLPTFMLFAEQRLADAQVGALGKKQLKA